MRSLVFGVIVFVAAVSANVVAMPSSLSVVRAAGTLEVTSTSDSGGAGGATCPHSNLCSLRRAIELANAEAGDAPFVISFAPGVFPPDNPVAIRVGSSPLPPVSRQKVTIDATGAGVSLVNDSPSLTALTTGLTATGANFTLLGIRISGFKGSCVAVHGEDAVVGAAGSGNVFGGCATGIAVSGVRAVVRGNLVGFTRDGAADPVQTGVTIAAGGVVVGGPAAIPGAANRIGFADVAIYVGSGSPVPFAGVQIERNVIGRRPTGEPAAVTFGVILSQPSNHSTVTANTIANAATGIAVTAGPGSDSVTGNRFIANLFDGIETMAIDLGQNGLRNLNDAGDGDSGPNTLINHPVITRATQARITGMACSACAVQLYVAAHTPGGANDYGFAPLVSGVIVADALGQFALDNPVAGPGDWVIAMMTDMEGNSSEFGPSARVGAGAILCGNVQLAAGWNHVGYFGAETVTLLSNFSPVSSGAVTAIYRVIDGTEEFERWFSTTAIGRTLTSVQPGESYWFYAEAPATLPGGFSLSFPLTVQLKSGWNDFVYLGATENVADAIGSLGTDPYDLYQFAAQTNEWLRFGSTAVPRWAREFDQLEACEVYQVRLGAPTTLVPLQP